MYYTQDENHNPRRVTSSVGAIGKSYKGREPRITPFNDNSFSTNFESISIKTQFNDSSNEANVYPPYLMSYGQPPQNYVMGSSSTDENYGMFNYSLLAQMSHHVLYQMMQKRFETSTWVNPKLTIHGEVVDRI